MVKIPFVDHLKKRAVYGDLNSRSELIFRTLHYLKTSNFEDEDVKDYLIEAFKSISKGMDANKALLLKGNISGKVERKDFLLVHEIGEAIEDCHNVLIDGATKNRKRRTPLEDCLNKVSSKYSISFFTAEAYYKEYRKYKKSLRDDF